MYKRGRSGYRQGLVDHLFLLIPYFLLSLLSPYFPFVILCNALMGLTSRVAKLCCSGHRKWPHSAEADISSDERVKSQRSMRMNRSRTVPELTASELDGVLVPRRAAAVSEGHREPDTEAEKRYHCVGYCANLVATTGCLARDAARKRLLSTKGWD